MAADGPPKLVSSDAAPGGPPGTWKITEPLSDGIIGYRLSSWSDFYAFIEGTILLDQRPKAPDFVWRGQRDSSWPLVTTLDRLFATFNIKPTKFTSLEQRAQMHLNDFKYAARGRRGLSPVTLGDREWWALGQHYGLATPFLDWTRSPFAAAYFAFEEVRSSVTGYRGVYALDRKAVELRGLQAAEGDNFETGRLPIIEFIEPLYDENQRLVSQGGLFSQTPLGTPIEDWIASAFEGHSQAVLVRIELPESDRLSSLRALNRMNINHASLFPDLMGASRATNLKLELHPEDPELSHDLLRSRSKR